MQRLNQHQAAVLLILVQLVGLLYILVNSIFRNDTVHWHASWAAGLLFVYLALLYALHKGYHFARHIAVITFTSLVALTLPEPFVSTYAPFVLVLPLVFALVMAGPWWLLGVGVFQLGVLLARAGWQGVYLNPEFLGIYIMGIGALVTSRLMADNATRTAEHAAQEALEQRLESEKKSSALRFQASLLDAVEQAVIATDLSGRITFWNTFAEQLYGWSSIEVLGKCVNDVTPSRESIEQASEIMAHMSTGRSWSGEFDVQRKDGSVFVAVVTLSPIFNSAGQPDGVIGVSRDNTQWRETAGELLRAKHEAEAANAAKSRFLANISHELRTPLGAIVGFTELLLDAPAQNPDEEKSSNILTIRRNAMQLWRIVDDLLDLHKVESGKLEIEKIPLSPLQLAMEVRADFLPSALEKGLSLAVVCQTEIPLTLTSDPTRLRQILVNIVGNAVKFTENGSIVIFLRMLYPPENGGDETRRQQVLQISVRDTGIGLSTEQREKLFVPFAQADASTTRRFGGTGLGLALSKRLAEALGGNLTLYYSQPGNGSEFVICIDPGECHYADLNQLTQPHSPAHDGLTAMGASAELAQASLTHSLLNLRVLVVDDAPDNQLLISRFLASAGAHVEVASDGREGVTRLQAGHADVVLLDIQMPILDGYHAAQEMRAGGFKGPIIALTAHAMKEERERCLSCGFSDFMTKPIKRTILVNKLSAFSPKTGAIQSQSNTVAVFEPQAQPVFPR